MKKGIGIKILASLALFAILASIVTVGIMSFMQPKVQKIEVAQDSVNKSKFDYTKINPMKAEITSSGKVIK